MRPLGVLLELAGVVGDKYSTNKYVNKKMFAVKKMKRGDVMVAQLAVVSGGLAGKVVLGPGPGWEGAGPGKMGGGVPGAGARRAQSLNWQCAWGKLEGRDFPQFCSLMYDEVPLPGKEGEQGPQQQQ